MKDYLLDLVEHTHALGIIDLVKIVGTDEETQFGAYSDDQTVVVSGSFKTPIADFKGTFGMPNLSKLKTIIGFDDYDDNAKINLIREDRDGEKDVPVRIHFETATGDFVNDYRLMLKYIVEDKVKNVKFKGATWDVEFEPTVAGIQRLKKQASANSEEPTFNTKTENGDLKIYFGDPSTHSGNFVFQPGVTGTLSRAWNWPVKVFLAIMDLPGDKKIRMADAGAVEIVVDSGLATYRYLLPAQAK
jgi:GTP cyclohydrolase II